MTVANSVWMSPDDFLSEFNATDFVIRSMLARVNVATLVQVQAVANSGAVTSPGFVDVLPLVQKIDGSGAPIPQCTIHRIPYVRIQGGANAVIIDPQVGDLGIAVFCDRDISASVKSLGPSTPSTRRQFNRADGIYIGGILNGTPTQYIQFTSGGVTITSSQVTINGPLKVNGAIVATGNVTAGSIDLETHVHTGVTSGSSNTGGPTG